MNPATVEKIAAIRAEIKSARAAVPPDEVALSTRLIGLAAKLKLNETVGETESLFREALSLRRKNLPDDHPFVATAASHLARLIEETGRFAEAETLYREALAIFRTALPPGHPHLNLPLRNLAATLDELRGDTKLDEARELFIEALAVSRSPDPQNDLTVAESLSDLGSHLCDRGMYEQADPLLSECERLLRRRPAAGGLDLANALVRVARLRLGRQQNAQAEQAAREAVEIR